MAEIFDIQWRSIEKYDVKLKQIEHFELHPEMLPFVGRNYPQTKILLLGESHYLSDDEDFEVKKMEGWYTKPSEKYAFKHPGYFNTRDVVHNFLIGCRSKAHSIFSNPAKALIEAWDLKDITDSEAYTAFAFFNYFQRPEANSGKSISLSKDDEESSAKVFNKIVEILKPQLVVFLSKKAYESYCQYKGKDIETKIEEVYHPTCKYWNKEGGKEKISGLFRKEPEFNGFLKKQQIKKEDVEIALKDKEYTIIEPRQRRFRENTMTCRVYGNDNDVSEIAWYVVIDGRRYGIGYVTALKSIWIWDYDNHCFVDENQIKELSSLGGLYRDIIDIICKEL